MATMKTGVQIITKSNVWYLFATCMLIAECGQKLVEKWPIIIICKK